MELNLPKKNKNKTWLLHFDYNKTMANFHKGDITLSRATCHIEFNSDEKDAVKGWITVFTISRTVLDHVIFTTHNFLNCFMKFFFSEGRFINNNL